MGRGKDESNGADQVSEIQVDVSQTVSIKEGKRPHKRGRAR